MNKNISLSVPNFSGNELEYVTKAIKTEWVSTAGKYIVEFENKIAAYVHTADSVACQSGTSGIHLALRVLDIEPGDLVIVPTLTFIAAVNPITYVNAQPVFMDCDDSLTIDSKKLEDFCKNQCYIEKNTLIHIPSGKKIKALIVVHVFGNMADMVSIMEIAKRYHLKVVEDATEALGTYYTEGFYKGKYAGTIGDIGVYSFNGNKIITTGGGGAIVSDDKEYLERCRHLSTQAKTDMMYFDHDEIGYNYRMTNLQAALGLAQLEQLESFIEAKKENYNSYKNNGISLLDFRQGIRSNYWFYSYDTNARDLLISYLNSNQVQTRPIWKLIHTLKPYKDCIAYQIETAYRYYDKIVNLPCSTNLQQEDILYVSRLIKSFQKYNIKNGWN